MIVRLICELAALAAVLTAWSEVPQAPAGRSTAVLIRIE